MPRYRPRRRVHRPIHPGPWRGGNPVDWHIRRNRYYRRTRAYLAQRAYRRRHPETYRRHRYRQIHGPRRY